MKQLSPKTKIKVEGLHKKKERENHAISLELKSPEDKERSVIDGYISCCRTTHTERWGPGGQLCSERFQSKCQLLRDLSQPPSLMKSQLIQPAQQHYYLSLTLFISFKALSTLLFSTLLQEGRVHLDFVHRYIRSISHTLPSTHSRHAKNNHWINQQMFHWNRENTKAQPVLKKMSCDSLKWILDLLSHHHSSLPNLLFSITELIIVKNVNRFFNIFTEFNTKILLQN